MIFHIIDLGHDIFKKNDKLAAKNREKFKKHKVFTVNVMGAIGSGKTTLISLAIEKLKKEYNVAVIAGDVIADMDASRFSQLGIPTIPANTGKECHLDANIVNQSLNRVNLDEIDILFMENVGNLICPADFDLGEDLRIVVVSVSEGDDIVLKHPVVFQKADIAVINKIDIADAVDVDTEKMVKDVAYLRPGIPILKTSKKQEETIDLWVSEIIKAYNAKSF
ncbi:MAG: hydrogenase nickel incorporation protein HypB [Methanosarcinaceae archaeon]|nr:hydrogenase nickel incorporation protein HypB [Methanosarcinaceae archaeon]